MSSVKDERESSTTKSPIETWALMTLYADMYRAEGHTQQADYYDLIVQGIEAVELPPGFRVLNDGPGREVLVDDKTDDPAPVFATREEAAAQAWVWWREIYRLEVSEA